MCFGGASDSDDANDFKPENQIAQVGRVSFDPNSSQVVGWESIWAIIDGEESEKRQCEAKMNEGVTDYIRKSNSMPKGPIKPAQSEPSEVIVDAGIAQYKDYEIIVIDDRNFIMQHRNESLGKPQFEISLNQQANGELEWINLPACLQMQLKAFNQEEM